jgi:rhamnosyl/mannosyltransferase
MNMNILHFGRFYHNHQGGVERHVGWLLQGLSALIHVDNLVANEAWASETVLADGYFVHKVPSLGIVASTALCPTMPSKARELHRLHQYDILHLHLPDPMSHLAFLAMPQGVKLVLTWHSDIIRQKRWLALYRPLMDRLVARADAIIVGTPAHFSSSTQLDAHLDNSKRHVIPFGIDTVPFLDESGVSAGRALRAQYGGGPIIFALGRHVGYKGFEYLICAMQQVVPSAILLLGGSGPLTVSLQSLTASLGLSDRVVFTGQLTDKDIPAYYHACDVFCLSSITQIEAFGLVQLEAMTCGKPVVCCELHNGVNYVNLHGETGLAVPPRNPEALAVALNRLLHDDELRARMGEFAHARVQQEFSLSAMREKTLAVYRHVLGRD